MIEAYGGAPHEDIPGQIVPRNLRSSFLIGADGKIEHVWDNVKAKRPRHRSTRGGLRKYRRRRRPPLSEVNRKKLAVIS